MDQEDLKVLKATRALLVEMGRREEKGQEGARGKSGIQYVRWGKTTCPSGAEKVYNGKDN